MKDAMTGFMVGIDAVHHEVHEGDAFFYQDAITLGAASQDYLITTPNTDKFAHLIMRIQHLKDVTIALFEGSDKTGTTLQTVYNQNRNSTATAGVTIHKAVSGGTTDGTNIQPYIGGLATGANVVSGSSDRMSELILKKNTKYILRITSGSTGNTITTMLNWYEHKTDASSR